MCNDVLAQMKMHEFAAALIATATLYPRFAQTAPTKDFFDRLDRLPFSEQ
jgi:hypothetical protein